MNSATRVVIGAALGCAAFVCSFGMAQESGPPPADAQSAQAPADAQSARAPADAQSARAPADAQSARAPADAQSARAAADTKRGQAAGEADATAQVDEEIVVEGQTPAQLQVQIEQAQQAIFDRFNEINSDDEFDIHCREETITGSHLLRHICQANFWRDEQARAGEETVRGLQGSMSFDAQQFLAEAIYKRHQLIDEMKRLAIKDDELQRELVHLGNLEQAMDGSLRRESPATASAQRTSGKEALPYGAAVEADVQIGRKPWSHTLTQRTFTFAHVYGEISGIRVKCQRRTERLRYKAGVEWTLPRDWGDCAVRVQAPAGTTFTLFEFQ